MKTKRSFFNRFAKQEKPVSRSLSLPASDWDLLESYRMHGEDKLGFELSLHTILHELIVNQINGDREFATKAEHWQAQLSKIRAAD